MKQGTMETAGRCVAMADVLAKEHGCKRSDIPIKVDDTGLGGGVTDRLHELGLNVYGINFGSHAHDRDEYFNRGAEMWFVAAFLARDERLDLSRLDEPTYKHLSAELRARQYKIQSDKTLRVESKEEFIKRVGRSPDDADGLVLAFAPSGLWEVLAMDTPTKPKPDEHKAAMIRQVHDAFPTIFTDDDTADLTPQTCGACIHWSDEKRASDGGRGRCQIRLLGVDAETVACELFERVEPDDD